MAEKIEMIRVGVVGISVVGKQGGYKQVKQGDNRDIYLIPPLEPLKTPFRTPKDPL